MSFYPIVTLATMEPKDVGGGHKIEFLTLESEAGAIIPLFTSVDRYRAFADVCRALDDSIRTSTFPMDPFQLADTLEPWIKTGEPGFLVFDPKVVSPGKWNSAREPIPIAHYHRFASEIRPGIRQAVREATFGPAVPGSAAEKKATEWLRPRLEGLADSAGARVNEWWKSRDARE